MRFTVLTILIFQELLLSFYFFLLKLLLSTIYHVGGLCHFLKTEAWIFPCFTSSSWQMEEKQTNIYRNKLFFNYGYSLMKTDYAVMHTADQSYHLKLIHDTDFFKRVLQTKLFKYLAFDLNEVILTGTVFCNWKGSEFLL